MVIPISGHVWLGVDWGTHSSKWVCHLSGMDTPLVGNILRSTLVRRDNCLIFPTDETVPDGDEAVESLKRIIISDPRGQSFWEADREDTKCSLGEAVTFSLCTLLGSIVQQLGKTQGVSFHSDTDIEIGFSFPNWLRDRDARFRTALEHFHQSASISCWIFNQNYGKDLPIPGNPYLIGEWKDRVREARKACGMSVAAISLENLTSDAHRLNSLKWRYLVESCAAGLPYLRSIVTDLESDSPPGLRGLGKLLVIDVGAGSTDVGYMLRTISRQGIENLCYFPPAATCGVAGNLLTEKLLEHYEQQGVSLTLGEAENRKISASDWQDLDFARYWKQDIARHVKGYVKGIPDKRWLPLNVPLQVILTGGAGLVKGLGEVVLMGIEEGLSESGVRQTDMKIRPISRNLTGWNFRNEAEYARRAVSIGAADKDKPALKYQARLDPPVFIKTGTMKY